MPLQVAFGALALTIAMVAAVALFALRAQRTCLQGLIKDGESGILRHTPGHGQRVPVAGSVLQEPKKIRGSYPVSVFDGIPPSQLQLQNLAAAEPEFKWISAAQRGSSSEGNSPLKEGLNTSSLSPAKMRKHSSDPHIHAGSLHVIKPAVLPSCPEARITGHGCSKNCEGDPSPSECEGVTHHERLIQAV